MNMNNDEQNTQTKHADPFGRLMENDDSQDRYKALENITTLSAAVGPTAENKPEDVAKAEIMLDMLGELNLAETEGPTGYYGERLRQAIAAYQGKNNLPQTGVISPNDSTLSAIVKALPRIPEPENRQSAARFLP